MARPFSFANWRAGQKVVLRHISRIVRFYYNLYKMILQQIAFGTYHSPTIGFPERSIPTTPTSFNSSASFTCNEQCKKNVNMPSIINGANLRSSLSCQHTVSMASSVVSRRSMLRRSLTYILFLGVTLQLLSIDREFNGLWVSTSCGMKATSTLLILFRPSTTASIYDRLLIPINLFFCSEWKSIISTQCKLIYNLHN